VELLDLVAARYRPPQIAAQMGVTSETARTYLKRLTEKLDLPGRQGLVGFASSLASVPPGDA
jgi:DNA-binding CsgD family transcriptional regulator